MHCNANPFLYVFIFIAIQLCSIQSIAQIDASETSGCAPLVSVEFSHEFAGASGILWDFDDGSTATIGSPTHTFQDPGTFEVVFTADGGISESLTITVLESPTGNFSVDGQFSGCIPLTVQFLDESSSAPGTVLEDWSWDFGDGGVSTGADPNPSHVYSLVGINSVTLIVEDSNGCTGTASISDVVIASEFPTLELTSQPSTISVCNPPLTVEYDLEATSNSPLNSSLTYEWEYGDGETSSASGIPQQFYDDYGSFPVSVTVTDDVGCAFTESLNAFIGSPQAELDIIGGPNFCDTVYFVNNSDPSFTILEWDDGGFDTYVNGAPDTLMHVYTESGDYSPVLTTSADGCNNDSETFLSIDNVDVTFTSSPNSTCEPQLDVTFVADSPNAVDFLWTFQGSQDTLYGETVTHQFTDPSIGDPYFLGPATVFETTLEVTTAAGCVGEFSASNDSILAPSAWFGVDDYQGCAPLTVSYADSSLSTVPISTWQFYPGDGSVFDFDDPDDFEEFEHTFSDPGEYQSYLIIENETGCIDTSYFVNIYVGTPNFPDVMFSNNSVCPGDPIDFTASDSDGNTDFWNIESDGGLLSGCTVSPDLNSGFSSWAGMHDITVYSNYNGCYSETTVTDAIEVLGPIGHLTVTAECETPYTVNCSGGITGATSWIFDFGDGNIFASATDQVVEHTYLNTGDYTITLTTYSDTGCPPFVESYVVHVRDIHAQLSVDNSFPCIGDTWQASEAINLYGYGSEDVYPNQNDGYLWHFGNGSGVAPFRTEVPEAEVQFPDAGEYNLSLITSDINGCTDTAFVDVVVGGVSADIDVDVISACVPLEVEFFDNSQSNAEITDWYWWFDDGAQSFQENPLHVFNGDASSFYNVVLIAADENGCSDTADVYLAPDIPLAGFFVSDNQTCAGDDVTLTPFFSNYTNYDWTVESLGSYNETSPEISFDNSGSYDVSLTVTNANGCTNSQSIFGAVQVQDYPIANFTSSADGIDNLCYPILIEYTDVSTVSVFGGREWDLGTGSAVVDDPTVGTIYDEPGTYTVTLEVSTTFGCTDVYEEDIIVEGPVANFSLSDSEICLGEEITMSITDSSDVAYYSWDFGNGLDSANISPLVYNYEEMPQNGSTFIQLISWSNDSVCSASSSLPFQVNHTIAGFNRNFEVNLEDTVHCYGLEDIFTSTSTDANQYVWHLGDGTEDSGSSVAYTYPEGGLYDVTLEAYNTVTGCADTLTKSLLVHPEMVIGAPPQLECSYDEIQMEAFGGETYLWQPSDLVNDSTLQYPVYTSDVSNILTVFVTDTNNCTESVQTLADYIFEPPLPLWTDSTMNYGLFLDFQIPIEEYHNYEWTNQYGVECAGCMYGFTPTLNDYYQLVITDDLNCFVDTFHFSVNLLSDLVMYVPNAFTPNNDGINDVFHPVVNRAKTSNYELIIWNRYGQEVWSSTDFNEKWQGNHQNGQHYVQPEVFVWKIKISDLKSIPYEFTGTVTLVR